LNGLVYSKEELLSLGAMEEDSHIPDREEDIKPQFYFGTPSTKGTQIQQQYQSKQQQPEDDKEGMDLMVLCIRCCILLIVNYLIFITRSH
jgi:hypothetical protein